MQRHPFFHIIALLLFCAIFTSCEDVIDINLKDAEPRFVIEAILTDQPGSSSVNIRKSVPFDELNQFPAVEGASVILTDDAGFADTLVESSAGNYLLKNFTNGVPGRTYTLRIEAEGKTFVASSTLPQPVPLDTLTTSVMDFFGDEILAMVPNFTDPVGFGNYYQFIQTNNGDRVDAIFVLDDANNDGIRLTRPLLNPDIDTEVGDTVSIEMRTIDRATYRYFYALDAASGDGPNAATPADPENNFGGTALGYFSAHTVQTQTIIVQ
jgi:Domain of unknown function (DUF4249)